MRFRRPGETAIFRQPKPEQPKMSLELAYAEYGPNTDLPTLFVLHGLYGSGRNWATVAKKLGDDRRVVTVDLRNHGDSPWADAMDYRSMAEDVGALIERRGAAPAAVLGHSMGGKTAMMLALTAPDLVERLAVVDIAPAPYDKPGVLVYADMLKGLDLSSMSRRGDVERALTADVPDPTVRAFLAQNIVTGDDGALHWRLNLDAIDTGIADLTRLAHAAGRHPIRRPGPAARRRRIGLCAAGKRGGHRRAVPERPAPDHSRRGALGAFRTAESLPGGDQCIPRPALTPPPTAPSLSGFRSTTPCCSAWSGWCSRSFRSG